MDDYEDEGLDGLPRLLPAREQPVESAGWSGWSGPSPCSSRSGARRPGRRDPPAGGLVHGVPESAGRRVRHGRLPSFGKILKRDDGRWVERSEEEIEAEGWPTIAVSKGEFDGEWPFRRDCATVECPDGLFYVVNIGGYDFALSGAARSKYRLPFAHEAGVTVLGKSVGPFIDMARGCRRVRLRR